MSAQFAPNPYPLQIMQGGQSHGSHFLENAASTPINQNTSCASGSATPQHLQGQLSAGPMPTHLPMASSSGGTDYADYKDFYKYQQQQFAAEGGVGSAAGGISGKQNTAVPVSSQSTSAAKEAV